MVVYETFDSNEAMFTKVQQGGTNYDLIGPSEYMVETMIELGLLETIDAAQLDNLQYIDEHFLDQSFDPGNHYSIPIFGEHWESSIILSLLMKAIFKVGMTFGNRN